MRSKVPIQSHFEILFAQCELVYVSFILIHIEIFWIYEFQFINLWISRTLCKKLCQFGKRSLILGFHNSSKNMFMKTSEEFVFLFLIILLKHVHMGWKFQWILESSVSSSMPSSGESIVLNLIRTAIQGYSSYINKMSF